MVLGTRHIENYRSMNAFMPEQPINGLLPNGERAGASTGGGATKTSPRRADLLEVALHLFISARRPSSKEGTLLFFSFTPKSKGTESPLLRGGAERRYKQMQRYLKQIGGPGRSPRL